MTTGSRNEFSRSVRVAVIKRCLAPGGFLWVCEGCGETVAKFEIHHKKMDAMEVGKRKLTAADAQLLCLPCHREETQEQRPILDKAKRQEDRHLGIKPVSRKIQSRGFQKSTKEPRIKKEPVVGLSAYARQMVEK
jgi:hypothetical protein